MTKFHDRWTVLPHGELRQLDEGLLTVTGEIPMPLGNFPRRMTIIALASGRVAIWSAMAVNERQMAQIEALGRPAVLIVPGPAHRLDARAWKARYTQLKVLCPPGAREAVSEAVPVDSIDGSILEDASVRFELVPGVKEVEAALLIERAGGKTLLLNDLIANVQHPKGLGAKIFSRLLHYGARGPEVPSPGWKFIHDRAALAIGLRRWADEPKLQRIVVSHGDVIEGNPARVLRSVADDVVARDQSRSRRG